MACSTNHTSWLSPRLLTTTTNSLGFKVLKSSTKLYCRININTAGSTDHHDGSSNTASVSVNSLSTDCSREEEFKRHWIKADTHLHSPLISQERFTVVSYNILGDKNAAKHKDLYQNVPSFYLNWNRRRRVVCEELIGWDPDIICLQEVDMFFDVSSSMEKAGYRGSYKRRTGDIVDGCAMFWKADKFRLVGGENIEFKQYDLRDNVAQLSVFEMCREETRRIVVGNVHVLFRPSRGEIKIGQAHNLSEKWGNAPVVLAGDYNSTPQSEIYKFLSSSELNLTMHNRRELSGQLNCHPADVFGVKREKSDLLNLVDRFPKPCWTDKELKVATGSTDSNIALHPLKLTSSYSKVKGSTETRDSVGEPLATSYHSKFFGTVDYLWYTNGLEPTRVLDTVPIDILHKTRGLPCNRVGSDHLALVAEFAFTENNPRKNSTQQ